MPSAISEPGPPSSTSRGVRRRYGSGCLALTPARDRIASGTWGEPRLVEWMASRDEHVPAVLARLDNRENRLDLPEMQQAWRGFLRLFQWLRHGGEALFVTTTDPGDYAGIAQLRALVEHGPKHEGKIWAVTDDIEDEYRGAAEALMAAAAPEPEVGIEIPSTRSTVWSEAELVWSQRRVALTSRADVTHALGEPAADWTILYLDDLVLEAEGAVDVSKLLESLTEETS